MFDLLDAILLLAVVSFGISGYRQGFLVGALSFAGFLGGAIVGAKLAPTISEAIGTGHRSPVTGIVVVFAGAILGQLIASAVGCLGAHAYPMAAGPVRRRDRRSAHLRRSPCCWSPG